MNKITCDVCLDLIPLVQDGIASEDSRKAVEQHICTCQTCANIYDGKTPPDIDSTQIFKKFQKKMRTFFAALMMFGIFFGLGLTASSEVFYNSLIMPLIGILGYVIFRWKALYEVPLLMLGINVFFYGLNMFRGIEIIELYSRVMYTGIYSVFVVIGVVIAGLTHVAFKKGEKNIWIKIGFVAAVVLVIGVGVFANALVGNPISKMLASNTVKKELETTYADKDFYVERITYSFKDGYYHAFINSESSIDSHFTICVDMYGEVKRDSYENVLRGWNTSDRLSTEYRNDVEEVFASPMFPFYAHIDYGMLEFLPEEALELEKDEIPEYAIIIEDLELDGLYDVQELGKRAGHLVLYVYDEEVSVERAAEILLEVKKQMDAGGVNFYVIDFVLEYPKPEDGEHWKEGRVETMEFRSEDIYEEGMVERVYEANEKAIAYHAARDAEMKE